jgi:fatty acid desaturase
MASVDYKLYRLQSCENLLSWHFLVDLFAIWLPILIVVFLSEYVSMWLYPFALLIIANRQGACALIGHEATHGLLHKNSWLNENIGRYLFHFPLLISHSRYKNIHLLHHRYVGRIQDPDLPLYQDWPMSPRRFLQRLILDILSLRSYYFFLRYFTELQMYAKILVGLDTSIEPKIVKSDFFGYLLFWTICLTCIGYFGSWYLFLFYWIVPLFLGFPYFVFQNALEHGAAHKHLLHTRTLVGNRSIIEFLLPNHLNYHLEHHLNPKVPHYRLKQYSQELQKKDLLTPQSDHVDVIHTLRTLFTCKPN